jgi:hypothetical protein
MPKDSQNICDELKSTMVCRGECKDSYLTATCLFSPYVYICLYSLFYFAQPYI